MLYNGSNSHVRKYRTNRAWRVQTRALEVCNLDTSECRSVNRSAVPQSGLAVFPVKLPRAKLEERSKRGGSYPARSVNEDAYLIIM
jgi:hypothetical protein